MRPRGATRIRTPWLVCAALASGLAAISGGCGPKAGNDRASLAALKAGADSSFAVPIEWLADSSRGVTLPVEIPPAVWVMRVAPASAGPLEPSLPEPVPSVPDPSPPPSLSIEPGLQPPIPRRVAQIVEPDGVRRVANVELDVEVGEDGRVGEVVWAGGSNEPGLVAAAVACARTMEFFPALRAGEPVAVWCRQRFEFGR